MSKSQKLLSQLLDDDNDLEIKISRKKKEKTMEQISERLERIEETLKTLVTKQKDIEAVLIAAKEKDVVGPPSRLVSVLSMDERKQVVEDVNKDRRYAMDASLVRIMKRRKVLHHQQLVSECVEELSKMFKPDIKMIKKRIEDLIVREYLERDTENPNTYKYIP